MPTYFFETDDGERAHEDEDGIELADDEAARSLAQTTLPDMASDTLPDGEGRAFTVRVRAADGTLLYSACLTMAGRWHDGRAAGAA